MGVLLMGEYYKEAIDRWRDHSLCFLGIDQRFDGVGLLLMLVLVFIFPAPQKLPPRRRGLLLLYVGQDLDSLGVFGGGVLGYPDQCDEGLIEVLLVLVLLEEFVDLDVVSDDLLWIGGGVPLRILFSVSSICRLR